MTAALFCLSAAGMLALGVGGVKAALPAAVAIGLGMGAEVDLLAYLIARHFPPSAFGTAYGGIYGLLNIGAAIGPAAIGLIYDPHTRIFGADGRRRHLSHLCGAACARARPAASGAKV